MIIKSNKQSMSHKVTHAGPPPKPVHFTWLNVTDSIILELWKKNYSSLLKLRGAVDRLKTIAELKLLEGKLDFWNLIEKNGVLEIIWKSDI